MVEIAYTQKLLTYNIELRRASYIYRPILLTRIKSGRNITPFDFEAILDSGADRNLFPAEAYRIIGNNVESGRKVEIGGLGDPVTSYEHQVTLVFHRRTLRTKVCFANIIKNPILGRADFFTHFSEIKFKEQDKKFFLID